MTAHTLEELLTAATHPVLPEGDRRDPLKLPFTVGREVGVLYRGGWTFAIAGERRDRATAEQMAQLEEAPTSRRAKKPSRSRRTTWQRDNPPASADRVAAKLKMADSLLDDSVCPPGDDYAIVQIDEELMEAYEPASDLVMKFVNLTASVEEVAPHPPAAEGAAWSEQAELLGLDSDFLRERLPALRTIEPMAARGFLARYGPPAVSGDWANELLIPAETLAEVFEAAEENDLERAFRIAFLLYREAPLGSLLAVLSLQALARLFSGQVPRRCEGCREFFTEPAEGANWHRTDAIHCSPTCRNRVNKRKSRERAKARTRASAKKT